MENNSDALRIRLEDLVRVLSIIVGHVETQSGRETEISQDYYWEVVAEQLYDPTKDPSSFSLGQLSDDWSMLAPILSGNTPPVGYALVWLASILRAVGSNNVA